MAGERLMALDVGNRRIGVAVSDPLRILARPLTTIRRRSLTSDVQAVLGLVEEHGVGRLIVGHPLLPSGDRGEQALAVEAFVRKLQEVVKVPIDLWDESYTTLTAAARMRQRGIDGRRAAGRLDAEAAAVILEEWMRAQAE